MIMDNIISNLITLKNQFLIVKINNDLTNLKKGF
jgi:hypothetical protein